MHEAQLIAWTRNNSPASIHLFLLIGLFLKEYFCKSATVSQHQPVKKPTIPAFPSRFRGTLLNDRGLTCATVTGSSTIHAHKLCSVQKTTSFNGNLQPIELSNCTGCGPSKQHVTLSNTDQIRTCNILHSTCHSASCGPM